MANWMGDSRRDPRSRKIKAAAVGVAALLAVSACSVGTGTDDNQGAAAAGYPITIDNCGYKQTFTEKPSRVLILQGASVGEATTMIGLGLEDTVLANAQSYGISDIPGMAEKVDALPRDGLTLNAAMDVPAEQVLARNVDLVISTWSGGFDPKFGFASRENLEQAGAKTLVNPVNCAYGKAGNITPQEQAAYDNGSVESSFEYITLIGKIFGVPDRAEKLVAELRGRIQKVAEQVKNQPKKKMLIAFPDMSAMNANGLPAVFSGNIYDSVIRSAGGEPSFVNGGPNLTMGLSAEQLAAAEVDVLVVGAWRPGEDLDAQAQRLFDAYPAWNASKTKTYVKASDGVYLGPANAYLIEKLAKVAHSVPAGN